MKEARVVSSEEYAKLTFPTPGMVLIAKDKIGDKHGKLWLPQAAIDRSTKWCGVGVIVKMFIGKGRSDTEDYLRKVFHEGDFVMFDPSTPYQAPAPLKWRFENPDKKEDTTMMIHIEDLMGHIFEDDAQIESFRARVQEASHGGA